MTNGHVEEAREPRTSSDRIAFRAGRLFHELDRRAGGGSRDLTARRDLGRYYAMVRDSIASIQLEPAEIDLLCEAFRNRTLRDENYDLIWAIADEAIHARRLDKKFHVDGGALVAKIRAFLPGQKLALLDALEVCARSEGDREVLAKTGLLRE